MCDCNDQCSIFHNSYPNCMNCYKLKKIDNLYHNKKRQEHYQLVVLTICAMLAMLWAQYTHLVLEL